MSAAEQTHPTSEPTVENSIEENAIDVISPSTNEVITKPEGKQIFSPPIQVKSSLKLLLLNLNKVSLMQLLQKQVLPEINSQQALRSEVSTVTSSEVVSSETSHSETNAAHEVEESP